MKLGVFTCLMNDLSLDEALKYFSSIGIQMVEIGCGGYPGNAHAKPEELLKDESKFNEFVATVKKYNLEISALSCHGNPVHPQKDIADAFDKDIRNTILLAEKLGLHQINTFSGCPGDSPTSQYPNWVTCPWPTDFSKILEYQWNDVLIPYWKNLVAFAKEHGVNKIALELHPGFAVYNTYSLKRLREAVGPEIGANFDPSHLIWQQMDPVAVIRELKDAIFHVHAKDVKIDKYNTAVNGVLDVQGYTDLSKRSWLFRSVGYGNDLLYWKDIVSALRLVEYDYVMSIEHEDALLSQKEGLEKAVSTLKESLVFDEAPKAWWV